VITALYVLGGLLAIWITFRFVWLLLKLDDSSHMSSDWVRSSAEVRVKTVGCLMHRVTAGEVVLLEDRDEGKVRAVAKAIKAARRAS